MFVLISDAANAGAGAVLEGYRVFIRVVDLAKRIGRKWFHD